MTLTKDYISSICEIKTISNDIIATGTLTDITEEYIEITAKVGKMPIVEYRTTVKVNIFNTRLGFRVLAGEVYTSGLRFIRLMNIISLVDFERRHFFRVDTNIRTRLFAMGESEDAPGLEIRIENVSLCGVGLISPERLDPERLYHLRLRLVKKTCAMTLRIIREEEGGEDFRYGCQIADIKQADEDLLCAFIFERQQKQIGRQRETL